jgi:glycosyltransferase involved in cell wall biosynthesis
MTKICWCGRIEVEGLNILSLCTRYLPTHAGADNMMHTVHVDLLQRGHNVTVVALETREGLEPQEVIDGINVIRFKQDRGYDIVVRAVQQAQPKPDVLFTQFGLQPYVIEHASITGYPVVVWCHGDYGYHHTVQSGLTEGVDLFVFNSTTMYEECGRNPKHVIVNPPVDRDRVLAKERDPKKITLINLCEWKGGEIFRELARRLPKYKFLGVEGGYGEQVVDDLPNNMRVLEHGQDMKEVYAATKILLMPSSKESFGMAGLEAHLNGIPVIASDLPNVHESFGKAALFVERDDLDGWVKAIKKLMTDSDFYMEMAVRARANVNRFDFRRDMYEFDLVMRDMVHWFPKKSRPGLKFLQYEYVAMREHLMKVFNSIQGRDPTEDEVGKILESAAGPSEFAAIIKKTAFPVEDRVAG